MTNERIYLEIKYAAMLTTICDKLGKSRIDAIHKALEDLHAAAIDMPPTTCDVCGFVSKTDIGRFKDGKNRCHGCADILRKKQEGVA